MTGLVVRKVRSGGRLKPKLVPVQLEGVVKLEHVQVICPACGQQVEAVARDGQVKGYCGVAKQYVDFQRKKKWQDPEYRATQSAASKKRWQDPEYRAKMMTARIGRHKGR